MVCFNYSQLFYNPGDILKTLFLVSKLYKKCDDRKQPHIEVHFAIDDNVTLNENAAELYYACLRGNMTVCYDVVDKLLITTAAKRLILSGFLYLLRFIKDLCGLKNQTQIKPSKREAIVV